VKGVMFNDEMVRALLAGSKTQTRRNHKLGEVGERCFVKEAWRPYFEEDGLWDCIEYRTDGSRRKPRFEFMTVAQCHYFDESCQADDDGKGIILPWRHRCAGRHHSRIEIVFTRVWQEPLQEISDADCIAEGIEFAIPEMEIDDGLIWFDGRDIPKWTKRCDNGNLIPCAYADLWDSINGRKPGMAWDDNPTVWAHEFTVERIEVAK